MATVKVTLNKPHKHAGKHYESGAPLDVSMEDARFLLRVKVIDKIPAPSGGADDQHPAAPVVAGNSKRSKSAATDV